MQLYIYDHCPFCARVRMLAGYKKIPLELVYVPYSEEKMLIDLVGKKAVPVLVKDDGTASAESLDILLWLDRNLSRYGAPIIGTEEDAEVDSWLNDALLPLQKIGYPRWSKLGLKEYVGEKDLKEWEGRKAPAIESFAKALDETDRTAKEVTSLLERAGSLLAERGSLAADSPLTMSEIKLFAFIRGFTSEPSILWPEGVRQWFDKRLEQSGMNRLV
ncbi:glutaredoxin 2 [Candidatus Haliotispira prima]|uniref:Glutaredoxin 2 n=1 Tax=Candidatus Haliotispira prima TaxID=3034016 RepID=A0ABY8MIC9_9SPIO|nr:glutaredoxin 2 [Candidatus Haliotispira prima]